MPNLITDSIRDDSVVVIHDGHLRIWWGDTPLGGKVQTKGSRCRWWRHDWFIDEYPGVRGTYRDRACQKCSRRKPLN